MVTISLPFGRKMHVCETCGNSSEDEETIKGCEARTKEPCPDIKIGDVLMLFIKYLISSSSAKYGRSKQTVRATVESIEYETPVKYEGHTLTIHFRIGNDYCHSYRSLTPGQILLWLEGDPQKLFVAGLIDVPEISTLEPAPVTIGL